MRNFLTGFLAMIAAAGCALVAWATPRPLGDLYMALAGGQDVLGGKLGQPDDWAFTTDGRAWINQSWGADALFYSIHGAAGDTGLLVLKAIILLGIVAAVVLAARQRGAGLAAGLLAAGAALLASTSGMLLRPNLLSLLLVPFLLFVLYRSRWNGAWLWGAVVLIGVWANLHGAFVVGLGILGAWALAHLIAWAVPGWRKGTSNPWLPIAALVVATGLAGLANPFGLRNLTLPLTLSSNSAWRQINEWKPVFSEGQSVPWEFLVLAGLLVVLSFARLLVSRSRESNAAVSEPAVLVFDVFLGVAVLAMVSQAQRFIPLSAVILAPLLAVQLWWLLQPKRSPAPTLVISVIVLVWVGVALRPLASYYDPDNPRRPSETVLERMVAYQTHFPVKAVEFFNRNDISGRVFNEWRWEGFLRWKSPQLKMFVGGRAQQVYDESTFLARHRILRNANPAEELQALDIHLAVVPLNLQYAGFCQRLLVGPTATWAYIYCGRRAAVLADFNHPETRRLIEKAAAGRLRYPDDATGYLSRGMCLASPVTAAPPEGVVITLEEANRLEPVSFSYAVWQARAETAGISKVDIAGYLESESDRLEAMNVDVADGLEILKARDSVARQLSKLYAPEQGEKRKKILDRQSAASARVRELQGLY